MKSNFGDCEPIACSLYLASSVCSAGRSGNALPPGCCYRVHVHASSLYYNGILKLPLHEFLFMKFDKDLDARGVNCPLPILRTKKALSDMQSGQILRVAATDPGAVRDFQAFSRQTGNELLLHSQVETDFLFYLRKR